MKIWCGATDFIFSFRGFGVLNTLRMTHQALTWHRGVAKIFLFSEESACSSVVQEVTQQKLSVPQCKQAT